MSGISHVATEASGVAGGGAEECAPPAQSQTHPPRRASEAPDDRTRARRPAVAAHRPARRPAHRPPRPSCSRSGASSSARTRCSSACSWPCSPAATCSSRASRASPRRSRSRPSPRPSTPPSGASSSRPTSSPRTSSGPGSTALDRHLRHRARPGLLQLPPRRRDQPRAGQGPVRAARGHAGAPGHDRPREPRGPPARSS